MTEERKKIIEKIHDQIKQKKKDLINALPVIHLIEDGIVIRFFSNWEQCEDDSKIRYIKIDTENPNEKKYNFFLPKGTILDIKKREYAGCIMCLTGEMELEVNENLIRLIAPMERCLESDVYCGRVLKDSYVVTHALPLS